MNPQNIEHFLRHGVRDEGYPVCKRVRFADLTLADGITAVTSTGDVKIAVDGTTGLLQVAFEFDADTSDKILYQDTLLPTFKGDRPPGDKHNAVYKLWVKARKTDAGADENADLKLEAWFDKLLPTNATAATAQATPVTATLAASSASTAEQNLDWYELDLAGGMTDAERRLLVPGADVRWTLRCNETAGTTDQLVSIQSIIIVTDENLKLTDFINDL